MTVQLFGCSDERKEAVMKVRYSVFIGEQGISVADEIDGYDSNGETIYALICDGDTPLSTGRLIKTHEGYKVGRVATLREYRKMGFAGAVVNALCERAFSLGAEYVSIEAQLHAAKFYGGLGFVRTSDEIILDCGIEHIYMRKYNHGEE